METDQDLSPADPTPTPATFDTVHEPRVVVGDRGAGWIVEGWDLFRQSWGGWLLLAAIAVCGLLLIDSFPLLQGINAFLGYVWAGGLMLACQANYLSRKVNPVYLFAGFRQHLGRLLGARVLVGMIMLLIVALLFGDLAWQVTQDADLQALINKIRARSDYTPDELLNLSAEVDEAFGLRSLMLRMALMLLLIIPVAAAGWFAPALIVLGNCDIKTALWYSLKACLINIWPFLINGLLLLILGLLALLPYGIGLLLLIPVFHLSMYLSYRNIFVD